MPGRLTLLPKLLEEIYLERPDLQALHQGESLFMKTFLCWCSTHLEAEYGERVPFFRSSLIAVHRETLLDLVKQCNHFLPAESPAWLAETLVHDRPRLLTRLQSCPNASHLIEHIKAADYLVVAVNPVLALRLMIDKWPTLFRSLPSLNSGDLAMFRKQLRQTITAHFIWPEAHMEFLTRLDPEASLARVIAGVRHPYLWPALREKGMNRTFLSLLVPLLTADISFDATDLALLDWCMDSSASSTTGFLPIVRQHLRRWINRLARQSPLFEQWARRILAAAHPHQAKSKPVVTGGIHRAPQGFSALSAGALSVRLTPLLATEEDEQQWLGYLGWWALRNRVYEAGEINKENLKALDQQIATPDTRLLGKRIPELMPAANGLNIFGYFKSPIGLGQMSRGVAAAHVHNGHPFRPLVLTNITMSADLRLEDLHPNYAFHYPRNIVVTYPHINYDLTDIFPHRFFRMRETIGYVAWEQRDLHPEWCKRLDPYDRLFAVSQFTADSVTHATGRICQVLPCVVEMDIPRAKAFTRRNFDLPEDVFIVGFLFDASSSVERKNPLGAAHALVRAFRGRKGVQVVIKVSNGDRPQYRHVIDSLAALFTQNGIPHRLITRVMPRADVEGLLAQLNLYLSLHRAEGFGYTIAEAMWLGVPVVATGYSGNMDFMRETNSYLVRYQESLVRVGDGPFQPGTVWADPDIDHAAELCDHIFTDRESTRLKTEQAEKDIRAMVSVGAVAARLRTLLE
jgi:glycosyltransferase involved in cell wall biosynthesis